jgi:hypothetical protein
MTEWRSSNACSGNDGSSAAACSYAGRCQYCCCCLCLCNLFTSELCRQLERHERIAIKPAAAGGVMILAETFDHSIFWQSLARTFATGPDGLLEQGFNATLEVALPKVHVVSPACNGSHTA